MFVLLMTIMDGSQDGLRLCCIQLMGVKRGHPKQFRQIMLITVVFFTDSQNGWASGYSGKIIHTTDGGQNWSTQSSRRQIMIFMILYFINADTGWAAGGDFASFPSGIDDRDNIEHYKWGKYLDNSSMVKLINSPLKVFTL